MNNFKLIFFILIIFSTISACQTVSEKIDEKTALEQKELSKWLNKSESDLKIFYGQPDKVEFLDTRNRNYVYVTKKFNIKCERKFELNPKNKIVGFSSKNCF
tara:strand:- start:139 stop:444 length:306 start_codon:yes stop_codon:yes gene_type:complete